MAKPKLTPEVLKDMCEYLHSLEGVKGQIIPDHYKETLYVYGFIKEKKPIKIVVADFLDEVTKKLRGL